MVRSEVCEYCLCDNKWHHVQVEYEYGVLTLRVDHGKLRAAEALHDDLNTSGILYIGGLPGMLLDTKFETIIFTMS